MAAGSVSGGGGKFGAEDVVEDHPAGTTTTADYNPDDPSEAYLIKGTPTSPLVPIVVGAVFVLTGVLGILGQLFGRRD